MKNAAPPNTLYQTIGTAYARWVVADFLDGPDDYTTHEKLSTLLDTIEPLIPQAHCRIVPTSFDANAEIHAFPRNLTPHWISCEQALRYFGARGVMTRIPIYWQFGFALHSACRSVGIPIFTNEPENIPVGAMALKRGGIDTVVSEAKDAPAFADYLTEKGLPMPILWVLIHRVGGQDWSAARRIAASGSALMQEVHVFPGVPILEQCVSLAAKKSVQFHLSDSFLWEIAEQEVYLTSTGKDPLPLYRYRVPLAINSEDICQCGKRVINVRP